MAILKIRDADGNVQEVLVIKGEDGKDYVLTEEDKREIASMITATMGVSDVPSQVSELGNDAGYITADALEGYALKTDIPTVPTNVSAFTNDAGYLTQHQSLADYAKKTEIPDVSGYTTMGAVEAKGYQTSEQVQALIGTAIANLSTETWTFTLEDGSTVTKAVCVK